MDREQRRAAKSSGKAAPGHLKPAGSIGPSAAIAEQFAAAFAHHQAGRLAEAERLYRQILAIDPGHVDSLHFLGMLAGQAGRNDLAIELIGQALALKPDYAGAHYNFANVLAKEGRLDQAEAHYRRVLTLAPDFVEAHYSLGLTLLRLGRSAPAMACFERALALRPAYHEAHYNLGYLLKEAGRLEEATRHYRQALELKPDFGEAHNALGTVLAMQDQLVEAGTCFERALALTPDFAQAHCNLGGVLAHQRRLDEALVAFDRALAVQPRFIEALNGRGLALRDLQRPADALAAFEQALAIKPDYADALNNRGLALQALRRPDEALACFDQTLAIRPDDAGAFYNRGNALQDLKRSAEALADYDRALAIKPDYAGALFNRGLALRDLQRPAEAVASFDRVLAFEPAHRYAFGGKAEAALAGCDWTRTATLAGELAAHIAQRKSIIPPFTLLGYGGVAALQLECARSFIEDKIPVPQQPLWTGEVRHHDKLRIAYLSSDFRHHPVSFLTAELFERHDRSRFVALGISFGIDDGSDTRARMTRAFDQFHDVRLQSDLDIAKLLSDLEVDIAVDLNGHTHGARAGILARRPAPIQVSYLGYPGTMGAAFIDYLIADPVVLPFDQQPFYTEKIVHLPECYWVTDSKLEIAARTPTRHEVGLPENGFVFCCFNNNYKITAQVFDVWMRLLAAVEGSVLWLLPANSDAPENLRREAAARGIDPARLVLADRLRLPEHLALHRLADLFVDTLPYNAHTTASDALWAGLPVLTCRGSSFVGRVAASMLQAVGLPELVTDDLEAYEALALRLATDAPLLGSLRRRLAQNRATCTLFDTDRLRRHIEAAYTTMWERQRRGESPQSFSVEPVDSPESATLQSETS
jgi:protein O-GlcNAc transferase